MTTVARPSLVPVVLAALLAGSGTALAAPPDGPPSRIAVTGTATANAPAARGAFSVGIEALKPTAAAASGEAARLTQAVSSALKQAGLAATELKGTRLTVNAQWSYDDKTRQRHRDGFVANSTLLVDTTALDRLGGYIDAALNAGATTVSDISYSPADADALRREALAHAVRNARGEAETIASAAGGQLGELLEINTDRAGSPRPMMMGVAATAVLAKAAPPTQVVPGDIEADATVTASWKFLGK